ncbi:glycoside hydrolase family 43 protein [Cellulomonas marina]|uniref:Glycosyl hydrolases family 43 n=1 Tax=Cellulomonas marina TaxID=988821 RepID=A0A1I0YBC6_9CELL|nr:glycoside hydrolase family 43 protein [Cellulomonas marina]GIG29643.1 glycosyl hydrolase family 43 [Cellulomonas marina]SFB10705.1 Glycosyl hydrolases family 43 [Cellulomonas marina]
MTTPSPGRTLAEFWTHDPFVLPHAASGTYHLYTTDPVLGAVVTYTSTDLLLWHGPTEVFRLPEGAWASPDEAPWAPEVHEHAGRFHLFTTLHDSSTRLPDAVVGGTRLRAWGPDGREMVPTARGTVVAVADDPAGPFRLVDAAASVAPAAFMTLDGTLFVDDDGRPWMVYAHEWVQTVDGTIEAVPLRPDLSGADGDPVLLLRGSSASWLDEAVPGPAALPPYVTDGPQLRRLPGGALLMLWSSYQRRPADDPRGAGDDYVQTWAVSDSGALRGPWRQGDVLVGGNAGHGMTFDAFDGTSFLVLHRGMGTSPQPRMTGRQRRPAGSRRSLRSQPGRVPREPRRSPPPRER